MDSISGIVRKLIVQCYGKWRHYWFDEISAYPISAFRILYGIYMLGFFGRYAPRVELLFSNIGVYVPYSVPDYAPGPTLAYIIYGATIVVILCFILGIRTRLVTPLLLLGYLYHYFLNLEYTNYSYNRMNLHFLIILCFAELDQVWSLSAYFRNRGKSAGKKTVIAWATRLIAFDTAIMYFGSGLYKAFNSEFWHSGKIIEFTYVGPWGTPAAFWFIQLGWPSWFYDILTFSVIGFELIFGFLLYSRRAQKVAFFLGTCFHLSNWVFLNIPEFMLLVPTYALFINRKNEEGRS